jgi:hypothetical protein
MDKDFPAKGRLASLKLDFESGLITLIEGCVTTKWVRTAPEGDLPAGIGIEFEHLSSTCTAQISDLIDRSKTKPYIPKC